MQIIIYSKSPTYEPSMCKLSKTQNVCSHVQLRKLVHGSGVHCHMQASSRVVVLLCALLYRTAQSTTVKYCLENPMNRGARLVFRGSQGVSYN